MESFMFYRPTIGALLGGVGVHIVKKAAQKRQEDITFSLKDYLVGHPYQTLSMLGASAGGYFALLSAGSLTLSAAFLAGVAANFMSDVASGQR